MSVNMHLPFYFEKNFIFKVKVSKPLIKVVACVQFFFCVKLEE